MINRSAYKFPYIVIAIFVIALFCRFSTMTFAQDSVKIPQLAFNNIESTASSFNPGSSTGNYASPKRNLRHADTRMIRPNEGQPPTRKVIRDFVLYNYAHLADDIVNGEGMYLETLYYLMGIEVEEKDHYQKGFLAALLENKRIPEFSEYIAGYDQKD